MVNAGFFFNNNFFHSVLEKASMLKWLYGSLTSLNTILNIVMLDRLKVNYTNN